MAYKTNTAVFQSRNLNYAFIIIYNIIIYVKEFKNEICIFNSLHLFSFHVIPIWNNVRQRNIEKKSLI